MLIKLKSLEWLIQTNLFIKITNSVLFRQTAVVVKRIALDGRTAGSVHIYNNTVIIIVVYIII